MILIATGHNPFDAFGAHGWTRSSRAAHHGQHDQLGATYYLAAVAVAIGFKMNLFNIGVDGQYRLAALSGRRRGRRRVHDSLPGFLRIVITLVVAMVVGRPGPASPALLKATRGVSEVISTIMLNAIATCIIALPAETGPAGGR